MRRLLTLAVLAVVVYLGYTRGLPLLEKHRERQAATDSAVDEAWRCVDLARQARATVSDQMRQFPRPPVDPGLWAAAMTHTGRELSSADSACRCGAPACGSASRALRQMRRLINQFDRAVRGDGSGFGNPATYQEEIDRLLADAEALLP